MTQHALLTNVHHKDVRIITANGAQYGDDVMAALTFPSEFRNVQAHYPIVFAKDRQEQYAPLALFGFREKQNLFLQGGNWDARYQPLMVQRQPFLIGNSAKGKVIHIDLEHPRVSRETGEALFLEHGGNSPGIDDPIGALAALLAPGGRLARQCGFCYELRLHRARGYGALKAILEILAEEEGLTLTEISHRLQRTPGSTKDYLSWLEDVDLVSSRQKRYSYADPLLRVWVRLHCRASAPSEDDLAREVHRYALPRLPQQREPALVMAAAGGAPSEEDRKAWGIIEID